MESILVHIKNKSDFFDKYSDRISLDLINYLINESMFKTQDIKIVIKSDVSIDNIEKALKEGLLEAYNNSKKKDKFYDNKQVMFFIFGVLFLVLSTLIKYPILKEIIIIAGWVAIWEVVDISLNTDTGLRINRKIIKKLLNCEIEVIK